MTRLRHTGWSFAFYSMRGDSVEALDGSTPPVPLASWRKSLQLTARKFRATRRAASLRGCEPICGGATERVAHERTSVGSTLLEAPPRTERDTFTMSPPYTLLFHSSAEDLGMVYLMVSVALAG